MSHLALSPLPDAPMRWGNPLIYDAVASRFPELKLIVPHIGRPWFHDAMVLARKHPNVYVDVSGATICRWWGYQAMAAFYEFGVMEKLIFGSDFPFVTIEQQADSLRRVNEVVAGTGLPQIPAEELEAIIHRDSLGLLGLA
jgi:predicted TIM-barrel fold metal-dependent hydrolase